jgi:hypothetical protein
VAAGKNGGAGKTRAKREKPLGAQGIGGDAKRAQGAEAPKSPVFRGARRREKCAQILNFVLLFFLPLDKNGAFMLFYDIWLA